MQTCNPGLEKLDVSFKVKGSKIPQALGRGAKTAGAIIKQVAKRENFKYCNRSIKKGCHVVIV